MPARYPNMDRLEILKTKNVTVGVLPGAGGRIVLLQKGSRPNILKSDPALWDYTFEQPVAERIPMNKIPFNGHIVWVGPQSEWWIHQDVNTDLKSKRSRWPPDPYLTYSDFTVTGRTDSSMSLAGPGSDYTGIRLEKEIALDDDGGMTFVVRGTNVRKESISWDLWLNTRIDGFNKVYVPLRSRSDLRMEYRLEDKMEEMPHEVQDGHFSFATHYPSKGFTRIHGKALICPATDRMFAFTKHEMLVIRFEKYERDLVHPEQGMVEIYNSVDQAGDALMELEYHTPYRTLRSGESMLGKEIWEVLAYEGADDRQEHLAFIEKYVGASN
jgi:hypothetical protein